MGGAIAGRELEQPSSLLGDGADVLLGQSLERRNHEQGAATLPADFPGGSDKAVHQHGAE
jgi:hypothetical protein